MLIYTHLCYFYPSTYSVFPLLFFFFQFLFLNPEYIHWDVFLFILIQGAFGAATPTFLNCLCCFCDDGDGATIPNTLYKSLKKFPTPSIGK